MAPMVIMAIISALEIISKSSGKGACEREGGMGCRVALMDRFGFTSATKANLTVELLSLTGEWMLQGLKKTRGSRVCVLPLSLFYVICGNLASVLNLTLCSLRSFTGKWMLEVAGKTGNIEKFLHFPS